MNTHKINEKTFFCLKFLLVLLLYIAKIDANAQLSEGGIPYGFQTNNFNFNQIRDVLNNQIQISEPDIDSLQKIANNGDNTPYLFAKSINIGLNIKSKQPVTLNDGGKLWIWKFSTKKATTLNAYFSKYKLQLGAKLFIYRPDGKQILGAFSSTNNQEHETLSVGFVEGNEIVIEYYEPNNLESEKSEIVLGVLGYGFRDGLNKINVIDVNESSSCNINVNCTSNTSIQIVKKSVAKILFQVGTSWFVCSGSVVNNTNQDGTPYFLTAFHCYNGSNLNSYIFYFNYESPNCANPTSTPSYNSLSGASLKSAWSGSDFALVQINDAPPISYNVFYAGFDATDAFPSNTIGIHHPKGDIKKLSTDDQAPTKGSVTIEGQTSSVWNTKFDNGTTEGGSSGSPLFNNNFRVIAQLYGVGWNYGETYNPCNLSGNTQYYGRLGVSWDGGGSSTTRLKDWLNPSNNNTKILDGLFYIPASISTSISTSTFCEGAAVIVNYTAIGTYNAGNVFTAQLSNSSGSFTSPINIGTLSSTTSGSISAIIPLGITGTAYRIRVISSNPTVTGTNNGINVTINPTPDSPITAQNGNWSITSTWQCGIIPNLTKDALINHTITIDGITAQANKLIYNGGTINIINNGSIKLNQ